MRFFLLIVCLWLPINRIAYADAPSATQDIDWTKGQFRDYEKDQPGAGYSQGYKSSKGWITVFSYTGGYRNWKEGLQDARLRQDLDSAIEAVKAQAEKSEYRNLVTSSVKERNIAGTDYYQVDFSYDYDGKAVCSGLYLTVKSGMLLKYRISLYCEPALSADAVSASFIMRTQDDRVSPPDKTSKKPMRPDKLID